MRILSSEELLRVWERGLLSDSEAMTLVIKNWVEFSRVIQHLTHVMSRMDGDIDILKVRLDEETTRKV